MKMDDERFKQEVRMSRMAFDRLLGRITTHKIYQNNSNCHQTPVHLQLLVTMYRLGCHGNGVSVGRVARRFGLSEGAVQVCTDRTIVAILSLEKELVTWPLTEEKKEMKRRIEDQSGFANCVGFVDGTLAVLETKPSLDGSDHHSRKSRYGLSVLIVCDDQRRIQYIFTGFCGSVHDNRVFKESQLGEKIF